jgi:predicted mannosyl-3-phosphoglycerate phosphatase (HAD superfamily)
VRGGLHRRKTKMHQVRSYEEFLELRQEVQELRAELAQHRAAQPEWVREAEAQQLTGLSASRAASCCRVPRCGRAAVT